MVPCDFPIKLFQRGRSNDGQWGPLERDVVSFSWSKFFSPGSLVGLASNHLPVDDILKSCDS